MFRDSRSASADENTFIVENDRRFTYREIFEKGDALYHGLAHGVVLILCERNSAFVAAYLGALRNGLVPLLIDAASTAHAIQRTIEAYRPAYVFGKTLLAPEGYHVLKEDDGYALFRATEPSDYEIDNALALLIPTSGSTGDPKCVRLSAENIEACTRSVTEYLSMTSDRVSISVLPFHYSYGLSVLHNAIFTRSAIVLTEKSVLDRELWQIMEDEGVTDFSGVPFIFEIMRRIRLSEALLKQLLCVTQAGGRLDPKFTRHFAEYFAAHDVRYFTMYGQTEAAPRISYVPPEKALEKLGSVGIPISCGKAMIAETGEATGNGELLYTGPNVCLGYAFTAEDLAKGDEFGGRLVTGDQASIDEDGYITIVGRKKRFIKLQGISVNLDHVEAVLKGEGFDCMVIGKDDRLVVCTLEEQTGKLSETFKANFSFHPTTVKVKGLEALPFNASGKPDYPLLTESHL